MIYRPEPCTQGCGLATLSNGCAGIPTGMTVVVGRLRPSAFFSWRRASPPYRTQRMDFAVPWLLACCRLKSGMHAAPYLVRVAWSHPGGRALLAFAPTTFSIPLPSAVHCVYPAVRLQELWVRLDHLAPSPTAALLGAIPPSASFGLRPRVARPGCFAVVGAMGE